MRGIIEVPFLSGTAQAGSPCVYDDDDFKVLRTRWVPAPLSDQPGDQYMALYVEGESLTDARIFPGDWVMFRLGQEPKPRDLVVVAHGQGVCVKFWHPSLDGSVRLKSANKRFPPSDWLAAELRVRGVVVMIGRDQE